MSQLYLSQKILRLLSLAALWLASRLVVFFENPWHDFIKVQLINRNRHRHRLPMKRKETNRNETRAKVRASSTMQQRQQ
uniref:Uncharacterized protein n=1 Tax=Glossina palpalis gambiensis TaxID=67801 RepID=A0A1B0APC8_9MUSC